MLIPPTLNLGSTDADSTTRERFYSTSGIYSNNRTPSSTVGPELSPDSSGIQNLYQGAATESRMFLNPQKMQSDLSGFHMHAAAAVVTGHPGSFPLNSPASYAAAAATAQSHSIVPTHYGSPTLDPTAPYYPSLAPGYDIKGSEMWNGGYNQPPHTFYQYEQGFPHQYPYDRCYAMDMNDGVRRKNATRESTNTLKAWLQDHKKNPYPTKGEKIMLAIVTKMTLTQVSTWFANARRRLKKENKMTWIPKNRANETGSGTDDRRASDDKDSDEKSDDEDCKSDKEDNEDCPELKAEDQRENDSCQYNRPNPSGLLYQPQNSLEPITQDVTEGAHDVKPAQEYRGMIRDMPRDNQSMLCASVPSNSLSEKLHSANMVQNPTPIKYETGHEGFNRPIWSPIDSQPDKPIPPRPYQYGADYQCQSGYPQQDPDGHRHSSTLPQSYPTNYDMPSLPHISMSNNSREGHHLHNHSTSAHMRRKIFSPMSQDMGKHIHGQNDTEMTQDPNRIRDYSFTSPMTNLRNYVDGFHGSTQQAPGGQEKSPSANAEQVSPSGAQFQQDPGYIRQPSHHVDHNMTASQPAFNHTLHRSMSGPYSSYYSDTTSSYPPHSLTETNQHHPFYNHRPNGVPTRPIAGDSNPTEIVRSDSTTGHKQHCQTSPTSCRQTGLTDQTSTCIGYYDGQADSSNPPRSTLPPPPYSNQCKYADNNPQTFMNTQSRTLTHRQSYDGLNPGSNQSASSLSPRGPAGAPLQVREPSGYGRVGASDDEEMRTIQSNDDKASR